MTAAGNAIVIDVVITALPSAPLHVMELWGDPRPAADRLAKAVGMPLPVMGRAASSGPLTLMRFEPTVWLIEGDVESLLLPLGGDGALTAIGGGIVRVRLDGPGWRRLLMEGGVFDAEDPSFAAGCCTATIIDHVNVRLHVAAEDVCFVYVPLSYAADLLAFWDSTVRAGA
jgi:heterotetrameric sarcosine oxidase gamma subunit